MCCCRNHVPDSIPGSRADNTSKVSTLGLTIGLGICNVERVCVVVEALASILYPVLSTHGSSICPKRKAKSFTCNVSVVAVSKPWLANFICHPQALPVVSSVAHWY